MTILADFCCQVTIEQHFVNDLQLARSYAGVPKDLKPAAGVLPEVSFRFPLDADAAIYDFYAVLEDGAKVQGRVRKKEEAKEEYDQAVYQGKKAFLLSENQADIFNIDIGNMQWGERCTISISYVCERKMEGGKIRLRLPQHIGAKYNPNPRFKNKAPTKVNYPIKISVDIHTGSPITEVNTLGPHKLQFERDPDVGEHVTALMEIPMTAEGLGDDVVFLISQEDPYQTRCILERSRKLKSEAMRLSFYRPAQEAQTEGTAAREFIFLIDRSGSMSGGRMRTVKESMSVFLRSLPEGCIFNVFNFESGFISCWKESQPYTQKSLEEADKFVSHYDATGGTEIMAPLRAIFETKPQEEFFRQVFLLTDGEVSNADQCVEIVRRNADKHRMFTFGIGSSYSEDLVKRMAEAGRGLYEPVRDTSDIGAKVVRTIQAAMQPTLIDIKQDLGAWGEGEKRYPEKLDRMFPDTRQSVYFLKGLGEKVHDFTIRLSAAHDDGSSYDVDVNVAASRMPQPGEDAVEGDPAVRATVPRSQLIHRLAARARILELSSREDDGDATKREITELALRYNLASKHTSFVAVHEKDGEEIEAKTVQATPNPEGLADIDRQLDHPANERFRSLAQMSRTLGVLNSRLAMQSNIDQVLGRGESLDCLMQQSCQLTSSASAFKRQSQRRGVLSAIGGGLSAIGGGIKSLFTGWGKKRRTLDKLLQDTREEQFAMGTQSDEAAMFSNPMYAGGVDAFQREKIDLTNVSSTTEGPHWFGRKQAQTNRDLKQANEDLDYAFEQGEIGTSAVMGGNINPLHQEIRRATLIQKKAQQLSQFMTNEIPKSNLSTVVTGSSSNFQTGGDLQPMALEDALASDDCKMAEPVKMDLDFKLADLIRTQQFNGSFKFLLADFVDENLKKKVELTLLTTGWVSGIPKEDATWDCVLATFGAIVLLRTKFKDKEAEWIIICQKALKWLGKTLKMNGEEVESIVNGL